MGEQPHIVIGNVNAFRDWSHVDDIVDGYILLAEKGRNGGVYNQGSMRTNSVLTYIFFTLENLGFNVGDISTMSTPPIKYSGMAERSGDGFLGVEFTRTKADLFMLGSRLEFNLADRGLTLKTDKIDVDVVFNPARFRPADVPVLLSDTSKIQGLGFEARHSLDDIIREQIDYYLNPENRKPAQ